MTKADLVDTISGETGVSRHHTGIIVDGVLDAICRALSEGRHIEIRGFGSFSLHFRPPRTGRNPKTGDAVPLPGKHVPHFKPGKELKELINDDSPRSHGSGGNSSRPMGDDNRQPPIL